ncbi:MauE/DoxX family redox-associated membrane protein [Paenibacillus xylanexedens]|uniref:MauE/DoxX family redox-associated membrane protein n=1 Tax=Paenibacillus xylanexedens TaxID=528191 RepID=UPI0037C52515
MIRFVLDIILVFIFFSSFVAKVISFENFKYEVRAYKIMNLSHLSVLPLLILCAELGLSTLFLLPIKIGFYKELIGIIFLIVLTLLTIRKDGFSKECSCYGKNHLLSSFPIQRNIIFILILFVSSFVHNPNLFDWQRSFLLFTIVVLITLIFENIRVFQEVKRGAKV